MSGLVGHTLFQGLARPPMIYGVTYTYMILNSLAHLILFIASSSFIVWGSFALFHFIGRLACLFEPNFIDIGFGFLKNLFLCKNLDYWTLSSYEPT